MKMRDIFEIFVGSSDMIDIEVIHGEQMMGIIGKKAVTVNTGKILQNNVCRRRDNA